MKNFINIKDKKPEEGQHVWYQFDPSGHIFSGKYKKVEDGDCFYGENGFCINDVTWWKPLEHQKKRVKL